MHYSCALVLLLALHAGCCEGFRLKRKQMQQVLPGQEATAEDVQYQESIGQMHDVSDDDDDLLLVQEEVRKEAGEERSSENDSEQSMAEDKEEEEEEEEEPGQHDTEESSLAREDVLEDQEEVEEDGRQLPCLNAKWLKPGSGGWMGSKLEMNLQPGGTANFVQKKWWSDPMLENTDGFSSEYVGTWSKSEKSGYDVTLTSKTYQDCLWGCSKSRFDQSPPVMLNVEQADPSKVKLWELPGSGDMSLKYYSTELTCY